MNSKAIRQYQSRLERRNQRPTTRRTRTAPTLADIIAEMELRRSKVDAAIERGDYREAGLQARTAVSQMAHLRALQLQVELRRAYWKALEMARIEQRGISKAGGVLEAAKAPAFCANCQGSGEVLPGGCRADETQACPDCRAGEEAEIPY